MMLHNDDFNRREYVVKVLLKVLDNFTMEDAINCMQVSRYMFCALPCKYGLLSCVIVASC